MHVAGSVTAQAILWTVVVVALIGGCTGSGAASGTPPTTPVPSLAARPIAAATPTPTLTPTPTPTRTSKASSNGVECGDTSAQAVTNDMVSASRTLPLTRKDFADRWNKHAGDTKTGYGVGKWTTLTTSGSYTSVTAPIPATQTEDQFWSIDYDANYMASSALMMSPAASFRQPRCVRSQPTDAR
jgi:hypothetical protein